MYGCRSHGNIENPDHRQCLSTFFFSSFFNFREINEFRMNEQILQQFKKYNKAYNYIYIDKYIT